MEYVGARSNESVTLTAGRAANRIAERRLHLHIGPVIDEIDNLTDADIVIREIGVDAADNFYNGHRADRVEVDSCRAGVRRVGFEFIRRAGLIGSDRWGKIAGVSVRRARVRAVVERAHDRAVDQRLRMRVTETDAAEEKQQSDDLNSINFQFLHGSFLPPASPSMHAADGAFLLHVVDFTYRYPLLPTNAP